MPNPYKGIFCPVCKSSKLIVQQTAQADGSVLRYRKCGNGHAFCTQEAVCSKDVYNDWHREARKKKPVNLSKIWFGAIDGNS